MTRSEKNEIDDSRNAELIAQGEATLLRNYRQQPVVFTRGEGVELFDADGTRFLDMTSGIAVCALGHAHPALTRVIAEQAGRVLHTSNLYYNEQQILAASAIVERSFADRVYFCNSGGEANEAALKLARRYQSVVMGAPERTLLVATHGSFHGRTFATLAVTGQEKYRANFGPLVEPVMLVPFGDIDAARAVLDKRQACCFLVEPIQAEGGIVVPPAGYMAELRELCDRTGTLLIFDEVQTGIGRTGRWFGHEWEGVTPDVMTLAKALGGGVPIGALACTESAARGLTYVEGDAVPHASTFGGNPLACAAARCVLETIEVEGLLDNCVQAGDYLQRELERLAQRHPRLCEAPRGRGLLRGLPLKASAAPVVAACRERRVLLSVAGANVIRFAPALIVRARHLDEAVSVLDEILRER
ncbi:MAG TPA: aspartate aminotransferase family protein [Kofleriaceae bacterium]|nr:aspartate aminotransferase family protein [Kofleriaceae bacterium]